MQCILMHSGISGPRLAMDINKLENIQRRSARFVKGDYRTTSSVTQMLQELGWQDLQSRRRNLRLALLYILDFQFMWIWPLRRVGSVVFVFCTKFGSNIYYSRWDRRTFASDIYLMTSRELTSGFDFWSRGHHVVCRAVLPSTASPGGGWGSGL